MQPAGGQVFALCCIARHCPVSLQGPNEIAGSKPVLATSAEHSSQLGLLALLCCSVVCLIQMSAVGSSKQLHDSSCRFHWHQRLAMYSHWRGQLYKLGQATHTSNANFRLCSESFQRWLPALLVLQLSLPRTNLTVAYQHQACTSLNCRM